MRDLKTRFIFIDILQTLNRMDQIAEEVKLALKPHFAKSLINKDEYKDIMRKTVPKVRSISGGCRV